MQKFFFFFLLLLFSFNLSAQNIGYEIRGTVQGNKPLIEYLEISAEDSLNTVTQRTMTDSVGRFSLTLKGGTYKLKSSRFNTILFEKNIQVSNNMDIGAIPIHDINIEIGEVVLNGTKKLIERKIDRLVFNIENSPLLSGGTAFDAIKNAPGVYLGNGESINIMGKSGVKVMIDDKMLQMSSDELISFMKSMGADNIKSIEVITNPSAKYDAQGNAGIINIVTKKGKQKGWNANAGLTYYQGTYNRIIGNTGLNIKTKRIDFTSNYTLGDVRSFEKIEQTNNFRSLGGDRVDFSSLNYEKRKEVYHSFLGQFDFKLNESSNIGISGNIYSNKSPRPSDNKTFSSDNTSFISLNDHQLKLSNYTMDLYFNHKLDTLGKTMNINASLSTFTTGNDQNLTNDFFISGNFSNQERLRSFFDNRAKIYSGNLDFKLPYKKITIETGAKIAHTSITNDFLFQNFQNNQWMNNALLSNQFDYKETNTSGYFSLSSKISDELTFQAGLRGEYTQTKGISLTSNTETEYNYFQLFPTAYVQYSPEKKKYTFNLSYSRRINRPTFEYLNPFISYQSPLFSNTGNPLLRPSFTNSLELSTTLNNRYIFTVFGNSTSKYFSELPLRVGDSNETRYTFDNIGKNYNLGFQTIVPVKVVSWWEISNTFLMMYQNYNLSYQNIQQNLNNYFFLLNTSNTFKINNDISLELSGRYRSSSLQGFYQIGNYFDMSGAVNIKLFQDKGTLSFSAHDLFYTNRAVVNIHYPNQDLSFTRYNDTRLFKLSFRYKFGNTGLKNKEKKQSGSIDEQNRARK